MKLLCTFVTYNFAKVGLSDNFVFAVNSILAESFYYVNYGSSIILSKVRLIISVNEPINTGSVVFKAKHELKCQNEVLLKYHFSGNTNVFFPLLRLSDKQLT